MYIMYMCKEEKKKKDGIKTASVNFILKYVSLLTLKTKKKKNRKIILLTRYFFGSSIACYLFIFFCTFGFLKSSLFFWNIYIFIIYSIRNMKWPIDYKASLLL